MVYLKYYCIVYYNDSNNFIMSVYRVRFSIKFRRSYIRCLCIVNIKEVFYFLVGVVIVEKVGDYFFFDILVFGYEY